jgi:DNA-binding MarR family transcriptional regulator
LTSTSGASGETAEELERALTRVARAILRLGVPQQALREGEHVDRSGYWVLVRLDESGGAVRLSDLAGLLELDLSTVSRQVRQLVDGGLVTRAADPVDGRACLLGLSERGRSVLDAVGEARRAVLRSALGQWESDERVDLVRALSRLADDLQPLAHVGPGR